MAWSETGIRWTDYTFNPVHGCSKSGSPGCANCYAERVSRRFNHTPEPWTPANASKNVRVKPEKLSELDSLPDPCWVFVNSMSDLFHHLVHPSFIDSVLDKIREHPRSAFQILTKHGPDQNRDVPSMPRNVMLGVSVGHPDWRYRIDWLREQDAETKFVSFEPLVEPIPSVDLEGVDWAIVGGESGPNHREIKPAWVRNLVRLCRRQNTAVFFKQHSGPRLESDITLDMQDGRGPRRIEEFPALPSGVVAAPREFPEDEQEVVVE